MLLQLNSRLRRDLLTYLITNPGHHLHIRELARSLNVDATNLSREVSRLEEEGIVSAKTQANLRLVTLNHQYPFYRELKKMLESRLGPVYEIRNALKSVPGIRQAFVYGSFAKSEQDTRSDIDLMVVGNVNPKELEARLVTAESKLRREVNLTLISASELKQKLKLKDPFFTDVWTGKRLMVVG